MAIEIDGSFDTASPSALLELANAVEAVQTRLGHQERAERGHHYTIGSHTATIERFEERIAALEEAQPAERIAVALENIAESLSNIVMNGVTTTKGF